MLWLKFVLLSRAYFLFVWLCGYVCVDGYWVCNLSWLELCRSLFKHWNAFFDSLFMSPFSLSLYLSYSLTVSLLRITMSNEMALHSSVWWTLISPLIAFKMHPHWIEIVFSIFKLKRRTQFKWRKRTNGTLFGKRKKNRPLKMPEFWFPSSAFVHPKMWGLITKSYTYIARNVRTCTAAIYY